MAWIEQTKKASRKSGGPQYYLQGLSEYTTDVLRHRRSCPVRLWTPYGVVLSGLVAVSNLVGKVGHDRIQSGRKVPSVFKQIAHWYYLGLKDIERVELEDSLDEDSLVIRPVKVKFFGGKALRTIYPDTNPLTITQTHTSSFFLNQIQRVRQHGTFNLDWVREQIGAIVSEHDGRRYNVDERDLLRCSGALDMLGISLGMYHNKGIDCPHARFTFSCLPPYSCPIEIEEMSSGFMSRHHASHRKQRVVLLCMRHDEISSVGRYVDVVELRSLKTCLERIA